MEFTERIIKITLERQDMSCYRQLNSDTLKIHISHFLNGAHKNHFAMLICYEKHDGIFRLLNNR